MQNVLLYLSTVIDKRQEKKVIHKMMDIITMVYFALLANANEWMEIHCFAVEHEGFLRLYLELPGGIPSHDTIQRVMAMVSAEFLQGFQTRWNEMLSSDEGEKVKRLLALDGKTQRGNGTQTQRANHIVSAVDERGFCVGQKRVEEKSNEITAIPELLDELTIKGHIITTDAMGTQTEIAKKIHKKKADYVLALKGNQGNLYEDVKQYFDDPDLLAQCAHTRTMEKARGGIEIREYFQTEDIAWLAQKKEWAGLRSIAMTRNTVSKRDKTTVETRYFISSLPVQVKEIARAIRGHWMVESYHWQLDVTFREDASHILDKDAAFNLNILRKVALHTLKLLDVRRKNVSIKAKRFMISLNAVKYLEMVMAI